MTGWAANANQGAERRNILNIQETNYQAAPVYEIRTTLVARERTYLYQQTRNKPPCIKHL